MAIWHSLRIVPIKIPNIFVIVLRLELIPKLRNFNPNVEKHLINLGIIANRDLDLINHLVAMNIKNV